MVVWGRGNSSCVLIEFIFFGLVELFCSNFSNSTTGSNTLNLTACVLLLCRIGDRRPSKRTVRDRRQSNHSWMLHGREAAHSVLSVPHATPVWLRRGRATVVRFVTVAAAVHVYGPRPDSRPLWPVRRPRRRVWLR